tara:strand:+ start:1072 stop:1371 length:300 start_codon:yes stop_codon:yes gene_type:complete
VVQWFSGSVERHFWWRKIAAAWVPLRYKANALGMVRGLADARGRYSHGSTKNTVAFDRHLVGDGGAGECWPANDFHIDTGLPFENLDRHLHDQCQCVGT